MQVRVLVEVDALEPASDCLPFYGLQLLKGKHRIINLKRGDDMEQGAVVVSQLYRN